MNESELKRYLIKSLEAQGGVGHRFEDRFKVGFPDTVMIPLARPPVFAEAKMIRAGAKLVCTPTQEMHLHKLWRPPHCYSLILAYHVGRKRLFAGPAHASLDGIPSIPRPARLDSTDWAITDLLAATLRGH